MGNFTNVPEEGDEGYDKYAEQIEAQMKSLEAVTASVGRSFGVNCLGYHRQYNGSACPGEITGEIDKVKQNLGIQGSYECYRPPSD